MSMCILTNVCASVCNMAEAVRDNQCSVLLHPKLQNGVKRDRDKQ